MLDRYFNVQVIHTRKVVYATQGTASSNPVFDVIGNYIVGIDFKSGAVYNPGRKVTETADFQLRTQPGLDIITDDIITEDDGTKYRIVFKHRNNDVPISFSNFDIYGMELMGA